MVILLLHHRDNEQTLGWLASPAVGEQAQAK